MLFHSLMPVDMPSNLDLNCLFLSTVYILPLLSDQMFTCISCFARLKRRSAKHSILLLLRERKRNEQRGRWLLWQESGRGRKD
uniref:Uncharacterized protein n=1 Tax=Arundo donax TaxID=35708 RepID=A0A0A8YI48_ARUDO